MHYDYETFSEQDIKVVGGSRYARDPSTRILMGAYKFDNSKKIRQFAPEEGDDIPAEFEDALADERIQKWAWNAVFELNIGENAGLPVSHLDHFCTMVAAMSMSFPGKLSAAGKAIGLPEDKQKNARGLALIRKFCKPNKPTKKNPSGLWTFENAPDDWDEFLEYNVDDVIAEFAIYRRVERWLPPESFWAEWREDYEINRAGLPMNRAMIENAQRIYEKGLEVKFKEMREITGLANPNSNVQLLPWLQEEGYRFDDLKAAHVKREKEALNEAVTNGEAHPAEIEALYRVLELRADTSMTSIKKFDALLRAMDDDDTLRFVLQFNGAQRTGRWAGRIYQPQNLPRPERMFEKGIETWAKLVETLTYEQLDLLVTEIFDLLKSCIRPAAQAPEGYVFIDADLNAIENRVLGWLARCEKILRVFELKRDPYIDFATYLFHESYDALWHEFKVEGKKEKRTIAKPGVLGCARPDVWVLTNSGWKYLIEVEDDDLLWDGESWVRHEGVVFSGEKDWFSYQGVGLTPDHKVLEKEGTWVAAGELDLRGWKTARDTAVGLSSDTWKIVEATAKSTCADAAVVDAPSRNVSTTFYLIDRNGAVSIVRERLGVKSEAALTPGSTIKWQTVSTQYDPDVKIRKTETMQGMAVGASNVDFPGQMNLCDTLSKFWARMGRLKSTESEMTATTHPETCVSQTEACKTVTSRIPIESSIKVGFTPPKSFDACSPLNTETPAQSPEKRVRECQPKRSSQTKINVGVRMVFDIAGAGPNQRFTIWSEDGPLIIHNCGYMLSAGAAFENKKTGEIEATGLLGYAWNMGVTQFTSDQSSLSVTTFRREFIEVKEYWYEIERAMRRCIKNRRPVDFDHVRFVWDDPFVRMVLPSGRSLFYADAEIRRVKAPWGDYKPTITYMGLDDRKMWTRLSTHPGKITENADQAISRDLLMHGISIARRRGVDVRLHVHDQIIGLVKEDDAERQLAILIDSMEQRPKWAPDLPLGSEGFITKVMKKD